MLPAMQSSIISLPTSPFFPLTTAQMNSYAMEVWLEVIDQLPKCDPAKGPWIAGGSVRRLLLGQDPFTKDIDYFCVDKQQYNIICSRLCLTDDALLIQETKDHSTYEVLLEDDLKVKVQVVKTRFRPTLQAHLEAFDFTMCQTGWDGENFLLSLRGYRALEEKELILTGALHNVMGSWVRLLKYAQQGFTPTVDTMRHLIAAYQEQAEEIDTATSY